MKWRSSKKYDKTKHKSPRTEPIRRNWQKKNENLNRFYFLCSNTIFVEFANIVSIWCRCVPASLTSIALFVPKVWTPREVSASVWAISFNRVVWIHSGIDAYSGSTSVSWGRRVTTGQGRWELIPSVSWHHTGTASPRVITSIMLKTRRPSSVISRFLLTVLFGHLNT